MSASAPAPSALRSTAPTFPGFSTPSTTITSGSSGRVRSASRRLGARTTATRPSARSPKASFANAVSVVVVTGTRAAASRSSAARASSPASNGSQTNASTTSTPASSARRSSRAPSTSVRPVDSRSRRSRSRAADLIRGFDGLARAGEDIGAHDAPLPRAKEPSSRLAPDVASRPSSPTSTSSTTVDSHAPRSPASIPSVWAVRSTHPLGDRRRRTSVEKWFEVVLESPGLAGRAVPVGRRVEDDAVVAPFPTDLARDEGTRRRPRASGSAGRRARSAQRSFAPTRRLAVPRRRA